MSDVVSGYLEAARAAREAARLAAIEVGLDEEKMVELLSGTLRELGVDVPEGLSLEEAIGYLDSLPGIEECVRFISYFEDRWINRQADPNTVLMLPNGIKRIGNYALSNCDFGKIIVPDGVEEIGNFAFWQNKNTGIIVLPDSVKRIGKYAFSYLGSGSNWKWSVDVNLPRRVEFIGEEAFSYISSKKNIVLTIPNTCSYIGKRAFIRNSSSLSNNVLQFDGRTLEDVRAMENYPFGANGMYEFACTDGIERPTGI